jgi:alpha-1,2-glucosyltransferase
VKTEIPVQMGNRFFARVGIGSHPVADSQGETHPDKQLSNAALYAVVAVIAVVLAASFVRISHMKLNVDETFCYPEIRRFLKHDFRLSPNITTAPGYPCLAFLLATLFGAESVAGLRLISCGISLLSIGTFYLLTKQLKAPDAPSKTFQYIFFPLLYPFLFLIYTDVTSLLMVFLGICLTLKQKYHLAGAIGIMSCLVRQDNIIWVGFMFLLMAISTVRAMYPDASLRSLTQDARGLPLVGAIVRKGAIYLLAFALFVACVVVNRGVALGDAAMHPSFVLHSANIFCLLFTFFFMFLPMNIANAPKIANLVRRHPFTVLYMAGFFLFFIATFKIDHPYNTQAWAQWFLSNQILSFFLQSQALKVLFFLFTLYAVLLLFCTKLCANQYYLIYPISILQMAPEWEVDPRYYLMPCLLFLAFKEEDSKPVRYITYAMYVLLSAYFFQSIVTYGFFF